MEVSARDSFIAQAVHSITSLGRKTSPPADDLQSTQYTGGFEDSEIPQSGHERTQELANNDDTERETASTVAMSTPAGNPGSIHGQQFFSRPKSSDDSPATGFSYTKAVMPTLNMKPSRGPAATMYVASKTHTNEPIQSSVASTASSVQMVPDSQPRAEEPQHCSMDPKPCESRQNPDAEPAAVAQPSDPHCASQSDAPLDEKLQPIMTTIEIVPEAIEQAKHTTDQAAADDVEHTRHDEDRVAFEGPTLFDVLRPSRISSQQNCNSSSISLSASSPPSVRASTHQRAGSSHCTDIETSTSPALTKCRVTAKIQKRQANPNRLRVSTDPAAAPKLITNDAPMDFEDLLEVLTIHYRNQMQQRDQVRAQERAKELEIKDLETISQTLHQRLQKTEERLAKKDTELSKYHDIVPRWQEKVKKLSDFVKGLSHDHARLRDDSHSIHEEQRKLQAHKESINSQLQEAYGAMEQERAQRQDHLLKSRHRAEVLEQALNERTLELSNESARLRAEHSRATSLQDSLTQTACQYDAVDGKLLQMENTVCSKISDLGETIASVTANTSSNSQDEIKTQLEECLLLLREPRQVASMTTDDVRTLSTSINDVSERVSLLTSACESSTGATAGLVGGLTSELESQFHNLRSIVDSGGPMREQLLDIREMKATVAERLRATESCLVDIRLQKIDLEKREGLHLQKISALETEVRSLRNQPLESPLQALRLHESEKECEKLHEQLATYPLQLEAAQTNLTRKCGEASEFHELLETTKADSIKLRCQIEALALEKATIEDQAAQDQERIRAELSEASANEISRNTHKFLNQLQTLRHSASLAEKDLEAERNTSRQLQNETSAALENANKLEISLSQSQQQLKAYQATVSRLEKELEEMRHEKFNKEKEFSEIQHELCNLREAETKKVQSLRSQLDKAEIAMSRQVTENTALRGQYQASEDSLAAATEKIKCQESKIREIQRAAARSPNPATAGSLQGWQTAREMLGAASPAGGLRPSGSGTSPRKSVVIEDSQDKDAKQLARNRPVIVEDSQDQGPEQQRRPLSSDELSSNNPLSYMPREVRKLMTESSSPLSEVQPTSSPVTDGRVMFPPSPLADQRNQIRSVDPSKKGDSPSDKQAIRRKGSLQGTAWTFSRSTTSTKSQSVTAALQNRLSSKGNPLGPSQNQTSATQQPNSPQTHHSQYAAQASGMKRSKPSTQLGLEDIEGHSKRPRLSSEAEKFRLGPMQVSPVKSGTSRRKTTLRRSKQGELCFNLIGLDGRPLLNLLDNKYAERFHLELQNQHQGAESQEL
ncbi:MAG: hypothetical protein Q9181_004767 [Wetmoreana brouardii]